MTKFKEAYPTNKKPGICDKYPQVALNYNAGLNDGFDLNTITSSKVSNIFIWECHLCRRIYKSAIQTEIKKLKYEHKDGICDSCHGYLSLTKHTYTGFIEYGTVKSKQCVDSTKSNDEIDLNCSMHGDFSMKKGNVIRYIKNNISPCKQCRKTENNSKMLSDFPDLLLDWNPDNKISPNDISYGSTQKVKWICHTCGYKWETPVKARTVSKRGCEQCNHKIMKFAEAYPQFEKNFSDKNDFPFDEENKWSNRKAIWICDNGHETIKTFDNVTKKVGNKNRNFPCVVCVGQKKQVGYNSLFDVYPYLKDEWDYEKNKEIGLYPETIQLKYSRGTTYWLCKEYKHSYHMRLDRKIALDKNGEETCPYCDNRKVLKGFNDLKTKYPDLALDYDEANNVESNEVLFTSADIYIWKCSTCGGTYNTTIQEKHDGYVCPYCSDKKVLSGFNDLGTTDSELAKEYSTNNERPTSSIRKKLTAKVLWVCPTCNGEYSYPLKDRQLGDNACPYCRDFKPLPGYNTLQAKHQDKMAQWATIENHVIGLDADKLLSTSTKHAWWMCEKCGRKYRKDIDKEVMKWKRKHNPCPYCYGRVKNKIFYF